VSRQYRGNRAEARQTGIRQPAIAWRNVQTVQVADLCGAEPAVPDPHPGQRALEVAAQITRAHYASALSVLGVIHSFDG